MTERGAYSLKGKRVWVAGHRGMVGSALVRRLQREDVELLTVTRDRVDLRRQADVEKWVADSKPQAVFIPAARVGGIYANDTYPAEFLYDNLQIASNIIHAAHLAGTEKLLFLGSSCIYPRMAPQPIPEEALLTGPLEPTNEWYAIAKIAAIKLCQAYRRQYGRDFISGMPTNLYGPGDNFHPMNSHVVPALLRRAHELKEAGQSGMTVWGTGKPRREFMHVDDCADALVYLMKNYSGADHINVGTGQEVEIEQLVRLVMQIVGLKGEVEHDLTKPDGTPRKLMSSERLRQMGWQSKIDLPSGLQDAYSWMLQHADRVLAPTA